MKRKLQKLRLLIALSILLFSTFGVYFIGKGLSLIPRLTSFLEIDSASTIKLWALGAVLIILPPAIYFLAVVLYAIVAGIISKYIYIEIKDKVK